MRRRRTKNEAGKSRSWDCRERTRICCGRPPQHRLPALPFCCARRRRWRRVEGRRGRLIPRKPFTAMCRGLRNLAGRWNRKRSNRSRRRAVGFLRAAVGGNARCFGAVSVKERVEKRKGTHVWAVRELWVRKGASRNRVLSEPALCAGHMREPPGELVEGLLENNERI